MAAGEERLRYALPFFLAMLANFLFFASMHLLLWTLPIYVSISFPSAVTIGFVIGVAAVTSVAFRPLAGEWADRHGRKGVMLLGALFFAIAPLVYAVAPSLWVLVVGRLAQGLGLCFFTTGYGALIPDLAFAGRRGEAIGLGSIAAPLSVMIAPPIGSLLQERMGFPALFLIAAAVALACLGVSLALPKGGSKEHDERATMRFRDVLRYPGLRAGLVPVLALSLAYTSLFTFLPVFATEKAISGASYFFVGYGISLIVAYLFLGPLSDRWGRLPLIVPGVIGVALCSAALTQVTGLWVVLGLALLYGLSAGGAKVSLDSFFIDCVPPHGRGCAISADYGVYDLGMGLGAWILGGVAGVVGYQGMYFSVGAFAVLALGAFLLLLRRPQLA